MSDLSLRTFPSLAVIIVNWNSFDVTFNCLQSLKDVDYPLLDVIIVDNGSTDNSGSKLSRAYPDFTFLYNDENLGFTGGNNTGIEYAIKEHLDLIMLLNNDTVVTPDFASILVEKLVQDSQIGAIQPKIMFNKERRIIWNAGSFYNSFWAISKTRGFEETDNGQYNKPEEIPWVTGCCFLTKTEIVKKIGLLDQKFFIYFEDTDWSFKIRKLGYKLVFEPSSVIYHEVGMSNQNRKGHNEGNVSPFSHYQTVRNHLYFIRRYSRGVNIIGAWSYQVVKFVGYIGYFLIRRRFVKLKFVLRGFRDGLFK